MKTYFISGHGDLTTSEFEKHYVPRLREAIAEGASFIVGDFRGTDYIAQAFLVKHLGEEHLDRLVVCHMFSNPRRLANDEQITIGGFQSDEERDDYMTHNSDDDIVWIRPGRNGSGTEKNLKRREKLEKAISTID